MVSTSSQSEIEIVNAFDGLAPPTASTSTTSSSSPLPCNVFINHRRLDVKHKLATDIYNALHALGLNVFLDSHDLHLGDFFPTQLQQAMSRASLHVVILSPTYAQSPWCLAELSFMLSTGTPVILVFYRVQPGDLRHLKGIYADFFSEHEEKGRYIDKLEEWKKVLMSKQHTISLFFLDDRRVLKNIVNRVLEVINIVPLEVAKYPVGLEELVADFEMTVSEFAKVHSHVQVVGIWGQLEAFLPAKASLASGSLVIVTTRDKEVLKMRGMILNATTSDVHKFPDSLWHTSMWVCGFKITRRSLPYELKVFVVGENYANYLHLARSSRNLAWLSCTGVTHRNIPSWMPLKNLRVLELHDCYKIVGLWKDSVEAPMQLRVLIISSCSKLKRFPKSIGYLKNLKKISISSCNVKRLPEEFCHLQSLEYLQLQYCERLSSLPTSFGHLTNLRHLDLRGCLVLRMLPDSCKHLTLLQHLDLQECEEFTLQSDILENMSKLEYLNLNECTQLEELPRHTTNQASLSELYLNETRLREPPINIGQLNKLRVMEIGPHGGCFQMQSLPDSMERLTLLEQLVLKNLELQSLPKFTSLWRNLKEIHLHRAFTRVSKMSISDDCCPSLKTLTISDDHLMEVDTLPTIVEDIWVKRCKLLRNISGIGGIINLQYLRLSHCSELDTLSCFDKLASLKRFTLEGANKVETIQGLQHCTSLEELKIEGKCWEVSGIESWENVKRLRRLRLVAKFRSAVDRCIQTIQVIIASKNI
ncbi:hypothetical protein SUGI_0238820 [Cryptomeria japonica]|nr:hypothetical protein SUGI_0238820 [Cryptomeria japonica]